MIARHPCGLLLLGPQFSEVTKGDDFSPPPQAPHLVSQSQQVVPMNLSFLSSFSTRWRVLYLQGVREGHQTALRIGLGAEPWLQPRSQNLA